MEPAEDLEPLLLPEEPDEEDPELEPEPEEGPEVGSEATWAKDMLVMLESLSCMRVECAVLKRVCC